MSVLALAGVVWAQETTTYQYDAQGRLIKSSKSGGPSSGTEKCIDYDEAGNRVNHTVNSAGCSSGGANSPPVANPNSQGVSCIGGTYIYNVVSNDSDPDGDAINLLSVSGPLSASRHNSTSIWVYGTNSPGTYVINYTIEDIHGATDSSTLTLTWATSSACGGGNPFESHNGSQPDSDGSTNSNPGEGSAGTGE